jgi:hypothetical protein
VVQTVYHTAKVHCNDAANIKNFFKKWCCKHWAGVSGNGNRIFSSWRPN